LGKGLFQELPDDAVDEVTLDFGAGGREGQKAALPSQRASSAEQFRLTNTRRALDHQDAAGTRSGAFEESRDFGDLLLPVEQLGAGLHPAP
jgi:hypothetical protein